MTEEQVRAIAKHASEEAVASIFRVLGIDTEDFDSMEQLRDDLRWIKRYRKMSERVGSRVIITVTTIVTTGMAAAVLAYMGFGSKN